jgi:DNA-binding NarL/FixJ family response regulator
MTIMGARVLIVDDHASYRVLVRRLLTADGFDVVGEAADAAGALSAARELRPDVVLLDVQLPDLDGFRVAEALAKEPAAPTVVLISSRARVDYGPVLDACPALGFIPKAELSGQALERMLSNLGHSTVPPPRWAD